jgi:alkylation response protein AidB-like acyl-CoA dehydrogenase
MKTERTLTHTRQWTRDFADRFVVGLARDLDSRANPEDCFSWSLVEAGDDIGLRTLCLSEKYGGSGFDQVSTAVVIEELARADVGVSVVFAQTIKISKVIEMAGTEEQQERILPKYRDDPQALFAIGITEPENASNYIIPYEGAAFKTRATRAKGGWVINGKKHFISNGNRARFYLVFAQTDPGANLVNGSTCFMLERGASGFSVGRVHNKLGERLANNAELIFEDCFVPDSDIVGPVNGGFEILVKFFPASNAWAAASILGVGVAAFEMALEWSHNRIQGGRPLIEHDSIAVTLAEMKMDLDSTRSYIHAACAAADGNGEWDPTMGALPKVRASQAVWKVVTQAMELHGGYGYMKNLSMEKLLRDAAAFLHSDGANRTLLLKAARHIR